jgi:ABC-type maltose transport system permease subunit
MREKRELFEIPFKKKTLSNHLNTVISRIVKIPLCAGVMTPVFVYITRSLNLNPIICNESLLPSTENC